jgi:UDP-glucuronate 4-epimerase
VTGAGGFLGVQLLRGLAAAGADVVGLVRRPVDDVTRDFLAPVATRVAWHQGDVTDRAGMAELLATGLDVVVHAAAVTATPAQEREAPARVFDVNAGGTVNLLEAARRSPPRRFVLVSSGGLYGPAPPAPALDEDAPLRGDGMYAIAKVAAERLALRYADLVGLDVTIGRLGTTYGPMERPSGSRSNLSAVQQAIDAMRAAGPGGSVAVRGADVARDFLHVDDAIDAFVRLAASPSPPAVVNVGAPVAAPLSDALDALADASGARWHEAAADEEPAVVQTAANARAAMDTRRLAALGWRPRYDLASGARDTWTWPQGRPTSP